ncbi:MAG TPA: DM13 domain-containing protein [Nitriliruptorales bacterium]|nr:DM13 domain-containing protein [Nitriliruptorales bacterium]
MAVAGVLGALGVVGFVLVWFQPQKLFIETRVDEDPPAPTGPVGAGVDSTVDSNEGSDEGSTEGATAGSAAPTDGSTSSTDGSTAATDGSTAAGAAPGQARVLLHGDFRSLEHQTTGRALVVELADGRRVLRFEDLHTSNGPDLRVYLSEVRASDDWYAYGERSVDLGPLKGNLGSQNYEIPADVDVSRYRSAVIWCRRFTVGFGVSPLDPPSAGG